MSKGNVYFLQVGDDGPIKIGFTTAQIEHRMRTMQMGSPHILRWIGYFPGNRGDERSAHRLLSNSHLRGEWFHPTAEVRSFVASKTAPGFEPVTHQYDAFKFRRGGGPHFNVRGMQ